MRLADLVLLTALLAGALVWPLHAPPIATHGEAREGLVVRDIVDAGRWVLPRRNGVLPSKPPLYHWIAAGAAGRLGLSDATVRMPSALAAWAMVLATFALGAMHGGRLSAWLAIGALLGMQGFWQSASEARVDMVFAACVTLALTGFDLWFRTRRPLGRAVVFAAVACGVLAKGPAGAVLPALVITGFLVADAWLRADGTAAPAERPGAGPAPAASAAARLRAAGGHVVRELCALWSWPLAAAVLALDLGWYAFAYRAGGAEFLAVQIVHENVDRFMGRGVFGRHGGRSPFAMVRDFCTDLLPWTLALVWLGLERWRGARAGRPPASGDRFLHAWWIAILAFFTAAYGKRGIYLLPLYPAVAVLAARVLANALATAGDARRLFGVVPIPAPVARLWPRRPALALLAVAIAAFDLVLVVSTQTVRLHRQRRDSLLPFARVVGARVPRTASLYAAPDLHESDLLVLAYRLDRPIVRAPRLEPPAGEEVFCLVPAAAADALAHAGYERVEVSARRRSNVALVRAPAGRGCAAEAAAHARGRSGRAATPARRSDATGVRGRRTRAAVEDALTVERRSLTLRFVRADVRSDP